MGERSIAFQPDWPRVLRDLTTCGPVSFAIRNPVTRIEFVGEPWYARTNDNTTWLYGSGVLIGGLTDYWAIAAIEQPRTGARYERLTISDHMGNALLKCSLAKDSTWSDFLPLLVHQGARRGPPAHLPNRELLRFDLQRLQASADDCPPEQLQNAWYGFNDARPAGIMVDPTQLIPFLETIADQACSMSVTLGNQGLVQQHQIAFFEHDQTGETLTLRGHTAVVSLDLGQVSKARVVPPRDGSPATTQQVRMYDVRDRCVATLGLAAKSNPSEKTLWTTMIRALSD